MGIPTVQMSDNNYITPWRVNFVFAIKKFVPTVIYFPGKKLSY
jgi:hypothetical protein